MKSLALAGALSTVGDQVWIVVIEWQRGLTNRVTSAVRHLLGVVSLSYKTQPRP
jgi:hypothetical protein